MPTWTTVDATHECPAISEAEATRVVKKHQDFKYPKGILINFQVKATIGTNAELAPHYAFKGVLEMNSYVDIVGKSDISSAAFRIMLTII